MKKSQTVCLTSMRVRRLYARKNYQIRNFAQFHRSELLRQPVCSLMRKRKRRSTKKKRKKTVSTNALYDSNIIRFFFASSFASLVRFTLFKCAFAFRIIIRMKAEPTEYCAYEFCMLQIVHFVYTLVGDIGLTGCPKSNRSMFILKFYF